MLITYSSNIASNTNYEVKVKIFHSSPVTVYCFSVFDLQTTVSASIEVVSDEVIARHVTAYQSSGNTKFKHKVRLNIQLCTFRPYRSICFIVHVDAQSGSTVVVLHCCYNMRTFLTPKYPTPPHHSPPPPPLSCAWPTPEKENAASSGSARRAGGRSWCREPKSSRATGTRRA